MFENSSLSYKYTFSCGSTHCTKPYRMGPYFTKFWKSAFTKPDVNLWAISLASIVIPVVILLISFNGLQCLETIRSYIGELYTRYKLKKTPRVTGFLAFYPMFLYDVPRWAVSITSVCNSLRMFAFIRRVWTN